MIAVHFGAGNIGRGFIGLLLNRAGYEVWFVDVNKSLVDEISRRQEYTVILADESEEAYHVKGVQAIEGTDVEAVAAQIANADLVTTAVGPNVLRLIAPAIAEGIKSRIHTNGRPLNVVACENMIGGSTQLKTYVLELLDEADRKKAAEQIGFPDAAVDRIVPIQKHEDPLSVTVEPYHEWVINRSQVIGEPPAVEGVTYVDDLAPYIERKLFTVNSGHAIIAYLGYHLGFQTIDQAIRDEFIFRSTKAALGETGALLTAKYQFDPRQHEEYTNKILKRFRNPYLADDVTRVGRAPKRKLSANDRLTAPAVQAFDYRITPTNLALGIAAALLFDYPQDAEAVEIQASIKENGLMNTIIHYTGVEKDHPLVPLIMDQVRSLQKS